MNILLDSNIYCSDHQLEGNAFRVFLGGLPRIGGRLLVPQIVLDEVVNKYRERLLTLADDLRRLRHEAQRLLRRDVVQQLSDEALKEEVQRYERYLREQLSTLGATILPYPATSHEQLVRRALARRRPFKSKDGGYRDALIWAVILAHLQQTREPLVLVTTNSHDFAEGKTVHPDLLSDLRELGLSDDSVHLHTDLKLLNQELILPALERLDGMVQQLQENSFPGFSLHEWVHGTLVHDLEDHADGIGPLEPDHSHISLERIDLDEIDVDDVRAVENDRVFIIARAAGSGMLSVSVTPSDFTHEDVRDFFETPGDVSVDLPTRLNLKFSLVLDSKTRKVLSFELAQIDSDYCSVTIGPPRLGAGP
jgi:hypothetical protein